MYNRKNSLEVNKVLVLTTIFLMMIVFSGCVSSITTEQVKNVAQDKVSQKVDIKETIEKDSILDSVKNALTSNKKLECTFISNEDGLNAEVKSYVQGDKYKTEFLIENRKNISIFDGQTSYSWEDGSRQGVKIDLDCIDSLDSEEGEKSFEENSVRNMEGVSDTAMEMFDGAQDVKCQEINSIDFSIPQDVSFIDQCEMLKNQQDLINQLDGKIPTGMPEF